MKSTCHVITVSALLLLLPQLYCWVKTEHVG
jgi:hypothetical protein